jgi:Ca2+-binding RTX toxin-like protein
MLKRLIAHPLAGADSLVAAGSRKGVFIHNPKSGLAAPVGYEDRPIATRNGDYLVGGDRNDIIHADGGEDVLVGGKGDDLLDGGGGPDMVDYSDDTLGVVVDLPAGRAKGAGVGKDTLIDIERAQGGSGDDVLTGLVLNDAFLFGGGGNDRITGGTHNDQLTGGTGDDVIFGGDGHDVIYGNAGANRIDGGLGTDWILDEGGASELRGGGQGDKILAGGGDDWIDGGDGDDLILAGSGNDHVEGGAGDDELKGGVGDDLLIGGLGADDLKGEGGEDWLVGGAGADVLHGGDDADTFVFQRASDSLFGAEDAIAGFDGKSDRIALNFQVKGLAAARSVTFLSQLESVLTASALSDRHAVLITQQSGALPATTWLVIDANGRAGYQADGDLLIQLNHAAHLEDLDVASFVKVQAIPEPTASVGADGLTPGADGRLSGTDGPDDLYGTDGDDDIRGGAGDDTIFGDLGDNRLSGGDGNDTIVDERGDAIIDAGAGDDFVFSGYGDDWISGGDGDDTLDSSLGNDTVFGGAGDDHIRTWNNDDFLDGGDGDDELHAGEQNDILIGGAGDDKLAGYLQDDILYGGSGVDILSVGDIKLGGRVDRDVLVFRAASESNDLGFDIIKNYFDASLDSFNLWFEVTGIDATVAAATIDDIVAELDAAALGAHHAVLVAVGDGARNFIAIDANGVAGFQSGEDLLIEYDGTCDMSQLSLTGFIQTVYDWE